MLSLYHVTKCNLYSHEIVGCANDLNSLKNDIMLKVDPDNRKTLISFLGNVPGTNAMWHLMASDGQVREG